MRYAYQPSFLRTTRRLPRNQASRLLRTVEKFQGAMEAGRWPSGLAITHLRETYFEFRVDLHKRVVFRRSADLVEYILYGNHNDIRRFLKSL